MKLYKFVVEAYDAENDDWDTVGKVLLPFNASYQHTEHALQAVGVYAPRGADTLDWGPEQYGEVRDASGTVLVRMTAA